jgi:sporulation protein YlmC with PRC-barrel domain
MRLTRNAVGASAWLLFATGTLVAQDANPPKPNTPPTNEKPAGQADEMSGRVWRATKLIDCNVKDSKGENIGEIEDLIIDKGEGRVAYGVLSFGGFLDIGDKLFAIPFATIVRSDDDTVVVLNVTKEQLKAAPNFAKDKWPDFTREYGTTVHEYYKAPPYWTDRYHVDVTDAKGAPAQIEKEALAKDNLHAHGMCRASKLIGTDVEDPAGKNLGDVDDVVIDDASGRIAYAVLSFGGFLGMGDKLFALPFGSLRPNPKDNDKLVLDVSKDKLKAAPGFDKNHWPNMADRRWGTEIHRYYEREPYWDHNADGKDH